MGINPNLPLLMQQTKTVATPKVARASVVIVRDERDTAHDQHANGKCLACRHITAWHSPKGWCGVCSEFCEA